MVKESYKNGHDFYKSIRVKKIRIKTKDNNCLVAIVLYFSYAHILDSKLLELLEQFLPFTGSAQSLKASSNQIAES